ncbi:MAG TPA: zinc-binding dehydrogenase [Baekduia sp.]|nr:zinc-binding dehydrogenase [Baekduia sp.]
MTYSGFVPNRDPDTLIVLDEALPDLEAAPDAVVIGVEAYSLNRGELFLLQGPERPGWRPGADVAGRVVRAAADGSGPAVGEWVVGHAPHGGWAEQVVVPVDAVAELPEAVGVEAAATLGVASLTALRLLRRAGDVAGAEILLTGAAGGLGHFLVELAAARGARVTAVTRNAERGERLLALGATAVVASVEEATGPFDLLLESVGGPSLTAGLARLRGGGLALWFGRAGSETTTLDWGALQSGDGPPAAIVPFSYWRTGASDAVDLATLARLVAEDRLHPEIGVVEDWRRTPEVLRAVRDRQVRGNAVLRVA